MISDDITRLTPLVEDLQRKGVIATWSTTSWPVSSGPHVDPDHTRWYVHAFRLRSHRLTEPLVIEQPFTEESLVQRLAAAEARETHGPAIEAAFMLSKDALYRDLASIYASRLYGKDLPVPSSLTIKDLYVPLTPTPQP